MSLSAGGNFSYASWPIGLNINSLPLTSHRLVLTWYHTRSLPQYNTTDGRLLRNVRLPSYVNFVTHAAETTRDTFVFAYRGTSQTGYRCAVSEPFYRRLYERMGRINIMAQALSTPDPSLSPTHLSIRRGRTTTTHYTHHQVSLMVSRNTKLVPYLGLRIGPACDI